jgi:heat shock protein HslJ
VMHLADDRATVKSDCNSCSGSYSLADNMLQIGALACTRVACQDGSLDPIFPLTLSATHTVTLDDGGLVLQNNAATLRFQR